MNGNDAQQGMSNIKDVAGSQTQHLSGSDRRRRSLTSVDSTTPPTTFNLLEIPSPTTRPHEGKGTTQADQILQSGVPWGHDETPIEFQSRPSTSFVDNEIPEGPTHMTIPSKLGRRTPTTFYNGPAKRCFISYLGGKKVIRWEMKRSRSLFGESIPPSTVTVIHRPTCNRSISDRSRSWAPYNSSTSRTCHFGATVPKTRIDDGGRPRCPYRIEKGRRLEGGVERKCSVSYIGEPLKSPDVVVEVEPVVEGGIISEFPEDDLHESPSCRICHDDVSEALISPCRCKGTIAHVHHSCLTRWLGQDITRSFKCELCQYRFPVLEARRYSMLESIRVWVRDPINKDRFYSFVCVSGFISMINLIVYVTAILVMKYTALSSAPDWFVVCMFLFLVMLYLWNLVQCFKDTIFDHWYRWWHNCVNVCLDLEQIMAAAKMKPSAPEESHEGSGSCTSHETCEVDVTVMRF